MRSRLTIRKRVGKEAPVDMAATRSGAMTKIMKSFRTILNFS
jgi:hypothetical protein